MNLLLIRHGETDGNRLRIMQPAATPLNEHGQRQASLLAAWLTRERFPIARIVSSDLARAHMTAEPIASAFELSIEPDPLLQERNFGDLRGRSYDSLDCDPFAEGYQPPAGESWETFHERVDEMWKRLTASSDGSQTVAVVTHGLVCRSLAAHHLRLPDGVEAPERWGNTSLSIIEAQPPWKVSVLNSTRHLDESAADDTAGISGI